jgi:FxsC-like protein
MGNQKAATNTAAMTLPIFVSYASDNRRYESDRLLFDEFVAELENEIGLHVHSDSGRLMFVANRDIQAGTEWTAELADALRNASVMLCFGSMHYFNSSWCGREFEVFRRRRNEWIHSHPGQPLPKAIIPVPWIPVDDMPQAAQVFQDNDAAFPVEYRQLGLRKLLELDRKAERVVVRTALGERIKQALKGPVLAPLAQLAPVHQLTSAFHSDSMPAAAGALAQALPFEDKSACFVFAAATKSEIAATQRADATPWSAADGWGWRPFHPQSSDKVGELAQRAASDRKLRFIQLECDANLLPRLKQAKQARVPVVIFADPWSVRLKRYRELLAEYDDLNLMNCAVLVPWNRDDPETANQEQALFAELRNVCGQKIKQQYPGHYWLIGTNDELSNRTQTVLDEITLRLIDTAESGQTRRAENSALAESALQQGIRTDSQPNLQAVALVGPGGSAR